MFDELYEITSIYIRLRKVTTTPQEGESLPPEWDEEKIQQLVGAYRATNHLDNSLKALGLSTSQRNRDYARELLKQNNLWKDK